MGGGSVGAATVDVMAARAAMVTVARAEMVRLILLTVVMEAFLSPAKRAAYGDTRHAVGLSARAGNVDAAKALAPRIPVPTVI